MIIRNFLVIIFLYTLTLIGQNTYLVDRDGTGDFSTINEVNKANFKYGDIVKFKSNQQFTDAMLECQEGVLYTSSSSKKSIIGDSTKFLSKITINISKEDVELKNLIVIGYKDVKYAINYSKGGLKIENCEIYGSTNAHENEAFGINLNSYEVTKPVIITKNLIRDFYKGLYLRAPLNIEISYNKIYRMYKYNGWYGLGGDAIACGRPPGNTDAFDAKYTLWIHHNELVEYEHTAIWAGTISRVLIEYNEIGENLDERLFWGGMKSGSIGKLWESSGLEIGNLGTIVRYNYIHDIKKHAQIGYKYYRPSKQEIQSEIIKGTNTGELKNPIFIGGNPDGSDYSQSQGATFSGEGPANIWIHNNLIANVGNSILAKGIDRNGGFNDKFRCYFINNTIINSGYSEHVTSSNGLLLDEGTSSSPLTVINNIFDFNSSRVRATGRYKQRDLELAYNLYTHQKGSTNSLPQEGENYASYYQNANINLLIGIGEQYLTNPNWSNSNSTIFANNIGVNGVYIPDLRINAGGNANNKGMDYDLIGDTYTVLGKKHSLGKDPTGRSFAYDILGNYRETNDIGAVGTVSGSNNQKSTSQEPTITNQPGSYSVNSGDEVTITIKAVCDDEIGYQWWKSPYIDSSSKITDSEKYSGSTSNSLTIKNITTEDSEIKYICEVYNTKDRAQFWVNSEPATISIELNTTPAGTGQLLVYLEAPYKNGGMQNLLNAQNYIPVKQPYSDKPWLLADNVSLSEVKSNYLDWVLIELRSNENVVNYIKAAILTKEGLVLNSDGSKLSFNNITPGQYYVAVKHRNHLGIMSSVKLSVSNGIPINYNFTDSQNKAFGTLPMTEVGNNKYAMFSGDADANGVVNNLDFGKIANNIPSKGYKVNDLDMNGVTNVLDYSLINKNILKKSNIK